MTEPRLGENGGARRWAAAVLVFAAALAARAAYGFHAFGDPGPASLQYDDERWYWAIGESLHRGDGQVGEFGHRAERMPLYPAVLSLFATSPRGPGNVRVLQWLVGAAAAVMTYALASRFIRWPVAAGLFVAFDPALCGSASLLLTETFFVTAVAALWWMGWPAARGEGSRASWMRWLALGAVSAICVYLREAGVVFVGALLLYSMMLRRDARTVAGAALAAGIVVAALAPWGMRNQRVLGEWYWFTTRGGISLYDGVRPGATGEGNLAGVKDSPEVAGLGEAAWDRHFRAAARRALVDEPARVAGLIPAKLSRTWSPWVHAYESRVVRMIFAAWYVPLYVLAAIGVWARRRDGRALMLLLLLPVVCVTLLHSVFVGSVRYRVGAIPALAILAAMGLEHVLCRRREAKQATAA